MRRFWMCLVLVSACAPEQSEGPGTLDPESARAVAASERLEVLTQAIANDQVQLLLPVMAECQDLGAPVVEQSNGGTLVVFRGACGDETVGELTVMMDESSVTHANLDLIDETNSTVVERLIVVDGAITSAMPVESEVQCDASGRYSCVASELTWAETKCWACTKAASFAVKVGVKKVCGWGGAAACSALGLTTGWGGIACAGAVWGLCKIGAAQLSVWPATKSCKYIGYCS